MAVVLSPIGNAQQFFGSNTAGSAPNLPLSGGLLYVYAAGTTTQVTTYTTSAGNVANTNPIVLDATGRTPFEIWWTAGSTYKLVLQDPLGNPIPNGTWDNIQGVNDAAYGTGSGIINYQTFTATAAQVLFTLSFTYTIGIHQLQVTRNGAVLIVGSDYTETTTGSFTLASGAVAGDVIVAVTFSGIGGAGTPGATGPAGTNGTNGTNGTVAALNPRGTWAGGTTYALNDEVAYNPGSGTGPNTYVSIQNGNTGNTPPTPPTFSTAWWNLIGAGGTNGAGSGTVTNTAGSLTSGQMMVGNGVNDAKVAGFTVNGTAAQTYTLPGATDTVAGIAATQTLTNKRVTVRVGSTSANSATPAINTDNYDVFKILGQTVAITSFTTSLTGTPQDNDGLIIEVTGTGAIALTWGTSFEASTVALPTTTVGTSMLAVAFLWNTATSKWRCVAAV